MVLAGDRANNNLALSDFLAKLDRIRSLRHYQRYVARADVSYGSGAVKPDMSI